MATQIFKGQIQKGKFWADNAKFYEQYLNSFEGRKVEVVVRKSVNKRSLSQNAALHLWFTQLAEALNRDGFDMRAVIKDGVDIFWSAHTIKEHLWRPVQKIYLGKESTTKLETGEIDKIFDIINKTVGEKTGVYVPWPCIDNLINDNYIE